MTFFSYLLFSTIAMLNSYLLCVKNFLYFLQICTDNNILQSQSCFPLAAIRVSKFLMVFNIHPTQKNKRHRPALGESGKWSYHRNFPAPVPTASVKRRVYSEHVRCHEASHRFGCSTLGLLGGAWNIIQNQASLSRLKS